MTSMRTWLLGLIVVSFGAAALAQAPATGPTSAPAGGLVNLARQMKDVAFKASGAFPDHPIMGAFDGQIEQTKPLASTLKDLWVEVDFPKRVTVAKVVVYQAGYVEFSRAKHLEIRLSDGTTLQADLKDAGQKPQEIAIGRKTSSLRLTVTDVYPGPKEYGGWAEIEVYGPAADAQVTDADEVNLRARSPT